MLVEFNAENFLSIKNKITLSLLASKDKSYDHHIIQLTSYKQKPLLKTTAIYGANASGKSNVLRAISFFKNFILNSHKMQQGDKIKIVPFKLDESISEIPSRFEVIFIYNGIDYAYGFSVDKEKVHEEYLYYFPKGRQSTIFERTDTDRYTFTTDKKEQKELSARTPANTLYLSSATQWNYKKTLEPFKWLREKLQVITAQEKPSVPYYTAMMVDQDPGIKETINRYLREADLGINSIKASYSSLEPRTPFSVPDVYTGHVGIDNKGNEKEHYFELNEESDGTQKFFSLLGPIINVLMNGDVLFIDELEASLHPHLAKFLVNLFHSPVQNKNNAQLIFTTHDTNILNLIRRDQVWFTEKNPQDGSTDLYSLLEFNPRKDQNIEKGYLAGRYGAVPFLGGGDIL